MYKVRVLVGGGILIIRNNDKQIELYRYDGTAGKSNTLALEPYQVLQLAEQAQSEWLEKNVP